MMNFFYAILATVWTILSLILFFKVWGMTNNVKEIKNHLLKSQPSGDKSVEKEQEYNGPLKVGDVVLHDSYKRELRIYKINPDGSCVCLDHKRHNIVDTFKADELKLVNNQ